MATVTKTLVEVWGTTGETLSYRVYADADTPLTGWIDGALVEFPAGTGVYVAENEAWDTSWGGFVLYRNEDASVYDAESFDPMYAASEAALLTAIANVVGRNLDGKVSEVLHPTIVGRTVDVGLDHSVRASSEDLSGDTAVDHDSGGPANLAYVYQSAGVEDGIVRAYLKSDYDSGDYVVRDQTTTLANGHWLSPLYLNSGLTYTLVYNKPGVYAASRKDYTVP